MKRELLSKAFGNIGETYIMEAFRPVSEDGASSSNRTAHMKKKRIIILALAVALMLALGIAGYARSRSCF